MRLMNLFHKRQEGAMDKDFIPVINCRYKVRKDLDCCIGFFVMRDVLIFNNISAFIVDKIDGQNSIQTIGELLVREFPLVENPIGEVETTIHQLQVAGVM